jgi:phage/plasmid-associated DNA primase
MVKLQYDALIEDVSSERCNEEEIGELLERFESAIHQIAPTSARKAWFDAESNSEPTKKVGSDFTLHLEREFKIGGEKWIGRFEYGGKKLMAIASHMYPSHRIPRSPNHQG